LPDLSTGFGWCVGHSSRKMLGLWTRWARKPIGRRRGAGIPAAVQGIRAATKLIEFKHSLRAILAIDACQI
jgi:hypothetical protein